MFSYLYILTFTYQVKTMKSLKQTLTAKITLTAAIFSVAPAYAGVDDLLDLSLSGLLNREVSIASKREEKLREAPGVVNIITGHGEPCGKTLTSHPLVSRISFTG